MNSKLKGNLTEAKIFAALLGAGKLVVLPGFNRRWDIGWEEGKTLIKVQCKTGRLIEGCIRFNLTSRGGSEKHQNYKEDVDFFGVYCPELDECYLIPINRLKNYEGYLRVTPQKNKMKSESFLWAKDFKL